MLVVTKPVSDTQCELKGVRSSRSSECILPLAHATWAKQTRLEQDRESRAAGQMSPFDFIFGWQGL